MASAFNIILVPVDFTVNTEVAVKKALDLAAPGQTMIYLLHILTGSTDSDGAKLIAEQKMEAWKMMISDSGEGIKARSVIVSGNNIQADIISRIMSIQPDLVIVGKTSHHNWMPFLNRLNPSEISGKAAVAVLTVRPGCMNNSIRTVVVPVDDQLPLGKMEILSTLCKKQRLKIHLVSFSRGGKFPDRTIATALLNVYQWIRTVVRCPVEYAVLQGMNKPRTLLSYAEKINADTLLLYPESETRIGWPKRHIEDLLSPHSKLQVLTVQPPVESFT